MEVSWVNVPIPDEDSTWELEDGARVRIWLHRPAEQPIHAYPPAPAPAPDFIYQVWTAAQVAATAITLGQAVAILTRRWRKKDPELPPRIRVTLTVTLPDDDSQRESAVPGTRPEMMVPAFIEIEGPDTKTEDELTSEIRDQLSRYAGHADPGERAPADDDPGQKLPGLA